MEQLVTTISRSNTYSVKQSRKIRSLDGLRAISICMVLIGHLSPYLPANITNSIFFKFISNGTLGVSIFFVISGYLITKLLIQEKNKTGDVSLKNFYTRRVLRIFPIFYLYILLVIIIKMFFFSNIVDNYTEIGFAAMYLWNYKHIFNVNGDAGNYLNHYWSLSMEEQFYLLWPIAFIKIKRKHLIKTVILIIICMPLIRVATYFLMPGSRGQIHMMIQTGGDTILIGCLAAILETQKEIFRKVSKIFSNNYVGIFSFLFLFIINKILNEKLGGAYSMSIGQSIENIFLVLFVLWCIYIENPFSKLLNTTVFVQIGIVSYSIYIWHVIILKNPGNVFPENPLFKITLIFLVGFLSYYLIETPILRLKRFFK